VKRHSYLKEETEMADDKLNEKLADYVEDAHAMEQNDLKMIAYMQLLNTPGSYVSGQAE